MKKRTLGTGGLQVSAIGYGCMGLAGVYGAAGSRQEPIPCASPPNHYIGAARPVCRV